MERELNPCIRWSPLHQIRMGNNTEFRTRKQKEKEKYSAAGFDYRELSTSQNTSVISQSIVSRPATHVDSDYSDERYTQFASWRAAWDCDGEERRDELASPYAQLSMLSLSTSRARKIGGCPARGTSLYQAGVVPESVTELEYEREDLSWVNPSSRKLGRRFLFSAFRGIPTRRAGLKIDKESMESFSHRHAFQIDAPPQCYYPSSPNRKLFRADRDSLGSRTYTRLQYPEVLQTDLVLLRIIGPIVLQDEIIPPTISALSRYASNIYAEVRDKGDH
ncbi:hypothetical protein IW262DRAFT_1484591 [Armillaria fumosa]|nr:hypothetical protein IW262DRAFT_1484591 [Armillaria fumosa]